MERQLELQKFHYFDEGNSYAGEKVKDADKGLRLRYRVEPNKEERRVPGVRLEGGPVLPARS